MRICKIGPTTTVPTPLPAAATPLAKAKCLQKRNAGVQISFEARNIKKSTLNWKERGIF